MSSGSCVFSCVHRDRRQDRQTEGQRDVTKLIVAFRNFANAPKISGCCPPAVCLLTDVSHPEPLHNCRHYVTQKYINIL